MLDHFLQKFDNILAPESCRFLIDLIDNSENTVRFDEGARHFNELNVNLERPDLAERLSQAVIRSYEHYQEVVPECQRLPPISGVEEFRVKRFMEGDHFDTHLEANDLTGAKRYLSFLFYLNEDFGGGHTLFYSNCGDNVIVRPQAGSVLVYPPSWLFPNKETPVHSGTKYIMSSYLNYTTNYCNPAGPGA